MWIATMVSSAAAARATRIERSFTSEAAWLEALFSRLRTHQ